MAAVVQLTRRMQIKKDSPADTYTKWHYRTQYGIAISNLFAVELWNSYSNRFPRAVSIMVTNELTMVLTNDLGIMAQTNLAVGGIVRFHPTFGLALPILQNLLSPLISL